MRTSLLAVVVCATLSSPLLAGFTKAQDFHPATAAELAMQGVDYAPGSSAAILDWVEFDDDTQSVSSEYYRVKIFSEEGKKFADVEVPYIAGYPMSGRVTDISARTIQPDGTIVPFDGKIYDKVLYRSKGLRLRAKTFSLAAVKAGSILEYRYQRRWSDLMLLNTLWTIQREIPLLRARMTLKPYDSQGQYQTFFTYYNLPPGKMPVRVRDQFELELTNVPVYLDESFSPPESTIKARVNFYYSLDRVKPEEFWPAQASQWAKAVDGFVGKPDPLRPAVQKLTGKDSMETLRNLYAAVQELKNLSYETEPTAKEKKNAMDTWTKREGYRMEINRTFVAMVRAAGLKANAVRVAPRDTTFFSERIPDAEQLSEEITAVTVDGKVLYFDPGTPTAPFGVLSWEKSATNGYRIAARGEKSELTAIGGQAPDLAVTKRTADLHLNGELLEGSVVATFSGQEALTRRLRSWGDDDAARTKAFEDEAKGWFPDGAVVKLKELTGATTHAEPVVAKFDVTLANVLSSAGSRTLLPLSVFESSAKNPFAPVTRTYPIYFSYPRREEDEVKVTLSPGIVPAAVPAPAKLNGGALQYSNETRQDGSVITFKRSMSVDTMLVDTKYYTALRTFYSHVNSADQNPIVLVEKP